MALLREPGRKSPHFLTEVAALANLEKDVAPRKREDAEPLRGPRAPGSCASPRAMRRFSGRVQKRPRCHATAAAPKITPNNPKV